MKQETVERCPVCNGNELSHFLQAKDYTTTGEVFSIQRCKTCELGITSPRPDQQKITQYYQSDKYISHTGGKKNITDTLYRVARNFMMRWKLKTIQDYQATGKLLDYGCGTGEFLAFMKENGWTISGIEPSSTARIKAEKNIDTTVFETIGNLPHEEYDVITLWHVAEHLHQLEDTIARLKQHLKTGGVFLIAVPNYQSPDGEFYKSNWAGFDVPRHLWHFTKKSIAILLEKNGMRLDVIKPMLLDAYYISYLSEGYQKPQRLPIFNLINGIIRGLISNLKARKKTNHSSLLYIARA